ncbi:MAG: type II secretion system minor pseudopilin GspI [Gammaproteobacteria bacterium]|nr:type II secretion system minor pseudopilin GspI [Gammaproteobacteria bacterium]
MNASRINIFSKHSGFTLMEVLVALLIVGIALGTVIHCITQAAATSRRLVQKSSASWIASNRMNELHAQHYWDTAEDSAPTTLTFSGREWRQEETVITTPNPNMRQVTIKVYAGKEADSSVQLIGYLINPQLLQTANPTNNLP